MNKSPTKRFPQLKMGIILKEYNPLSDLLDGKLLDLAIHECLIQEDINGLFEVLDGSFYIEKRVFQNFQ